MTGVLPRRADVPNFRHLVRQSYPAEQVGLIPVPVPVPW